MLGFGYRAKSIIKQGGAYDQGRIKKQKPPVARRFSFKAIASVFSLPPNISPIEFTVNKKVQFALHYFIAEIQARSAIKHNGTYLTDNAAHKRRQDKYA